MLVESCKQEGMLKLTLLHQGCIQGFCSFRRSQKLATMHPSSQYHRLRQLPSQVCRCICTASFRL